MGHMDADLMGAAGLKSARDLRNLPFVGPKALIDTIVCYGDTTVLANDALFEPIVGIASQPGFNGGFSRIGHAPDESGVGPLERAGAPVIGELSGKSLVGGFGLGGDHN